MLQSKPSEGYEEKLTAGLEYQDFVAYQLARRGIVFCNYQSKIWQEKLGENALGLEIKLDRKLSTTGSIYIEIAEKRRATNEDYVISGIYRRDNSFLYAVGDYAELFIWGKRQLLQIHADLDTHKITGFRDIRTKTSVGFTIPVDFARSNCLLYIAFDAQKQK